MASSKLPRLFSELEPPLTGWVNDAVSAMGFDQMTPVQASTIPLFMQNKDVVVQAVTGSGKTLSFVIPIIEKLLKLGPRNPCDIGAIVISPTRELAQQIHGVFNNFLESQPCTNDSDQAGPSTLPLNDPFLKVMLLIGGTGHRSIKHDLSEFKDRGANILVGTPGRLEEFLLGYSTLEKTKKAKSMDLSSASLFHKHANLKGLEVLVLDEADRLLDLGFAPVLSSIMNNLPKQRRTGLFSATLLNDGLTELIRVGLRNPVKVVVKVQTATDKLKEDNESPLGLRNYYVSVPKIEWKMSQFVRILNNMAYPKENKKHSSRKIIAYFATCGFILSTVNELKSFTLYSLHGQQSPKRRSITFEAFKNSPASIPTVLLCTDLVARGLDLPDVDAVIQYDPPKDIRNFSHRIGRTARAGREGEAIVMLQSERELDYVSYLDIKKIKLLQKPYLSFSGCGVDLSNDRSFMDSEANNFNNRVKEIVKSDRDLHDRAVKALVSYVQFYSKHEASYIFSLDHLDVLSLAFNGFGLVRLPKMPELKKYCCEGGPLTDQGFAANEEFDWKSYKYLDPAKEANRVENIKNQVQKPIAPKKSKQMIGLAPVDNKIMKLESQKVPTKAPWSNKINSKISKEQKRLKRLKNNESSKKREEKDDCNQEDMEADWKELIRENKARKKLKRDKKNINRGPLHTTPL
ncbi:P-loop containing nucleoside triphosphate hydrolase protein [Phakopsora pachyrhizi]|nr:P-loop containing nucleoside triphosphate hydrolase protein [Phakopsora pachyrhizi]